MPTEPATPPTSPDHEASGRERLPHAVARASPNLAGAGSSAAPAPTTTNPLLRVLDLGLVPYRDAHQLQYDLVEEVLAGREDDLALVGVLVLLEHPPVVTIGRRPGAARHLVLPPEVLASRGIDVVETDRGGDVTFHGPGQLVAYPILDLNRLNLGLHAYMRLLEQVVIDTLAPMGIAGERDAAATGVWVRQGRSGGNPDVPGQTTLSKIAAMGVRVRKWVSLHGLALNVTTKLDDFATIVPCGLAGRPVTSMRELLGERCPPIALVRERLREQLVRHTIDAHTHAREARARARAATNATNKGGGLDLGTDL
ncbi:MAG: lipoyl(octanoyl) transferase LipB [Planctomycetota bacterium]|nr:lipoyl(octanoyl) transferase LipB [Planctomycetota bacterium]